MTTLPIAGRSGEPPAWPLKLATDAELGVWRDVWTTPQAVAWEQLGWTRVVARYCRVVLAAEALDKDALSEARQLEDRLGLSPKAMRLLLWVVVDEEPVASPRPADSHRARGRIKAVS